MYQQVVKLRETVLGKEHLGTLSSTNNLSQNSPVVVTLAHGLTAPLYIQQEILILVPFFI